MSLRHLNGPQKKVLLALTPYNRSTIGVPAAKAPLQLFDIKLSSNAKTPTANPLAFFQTAQKIEHNHRRANK